MYKTNKQGLLGDIWPLVRSMRYTGFWTFRYYEDPSFAVLLVRIAYCTLTTVSSVAQLLFLMLFLMLDSHGGDEMAASTITLLFFAHGLSKYLYFAVRSNIFYRCLGAWNTMNSHPLFAESQARHRAQSLARSRRLINFVGLMTVAAPLAWTVCTFLDDSVRQVPDPDDPAGNKTITVPVPRLMLPSHYFWDPSEGWLYLATFSYQFIWMLMSLAHSNIMDTMFCCLAIFAGEQLRHLKESLRPLIELSASLDTAVPDAQRFFRPPSSSDETAVLYGDEPDRYNDELDLTLAYRRGTTFQPQRSFGAGGDGGGPNGLSKKQELLVRSAIKYWVERHKHIVKYVGFLGQAFGLALLIHMLTSTVTLTLLAYQATKVDSANLYALYVGGYLVYSLGQVFIFCLYGNELIEQSTSVMEAAYSCHWYDGSDEAKTFIQIVCQQSQKSLSVSGAKFFTISLDLFASVLGATVTYFMVLVQLK